MLKRMSLASLLPVGFVPTQEPEKARAFYEKTLGLLFVSEDAFALVFRTGGGAMLRVVKMENFQPAPYTIFGWETAAIEQEVDELLQRGVILERYSFFEQDERGIWGAPNGDKAAWFKDPDGNLLSLSQHE